MKTQLEIHSQDLDIVINGEAKSCIGLELQVNAIKFLIESFDFKFVEEDDPEASQKIFLVLLDTLGSRLKGEMPAFNNDETKNIEVVHQFLSWILKQEVHKQPGYAELLDQEEELELEW